MIKVIFLIVAAFLQGAAMSEMPSKCFTPSKFVACERVFGSALWGNYTVNWDTVDAVRTIK